MKTIKDSNGNVKAVKFKGRGGGYNIVLDKNSKKLGKEMDRKRAGGPAEEQSDEAICCKIN